MVQPAGGFSCARAFRADTLAAYSSAVECVIQAMHTHISEPLTLDEMAEIASLSPFHFNRMFRTITGIPPGEFLSALRLEAAKRLLLTTSLNATDICMDLGYASVGTFVTRFKQLIGVSPLQLRYLASDFTATSLQTRVSQRVEAQRMTVGHAHGVSGYITAPDAFNGLIFAGLFPKPIPHNRPVACVTLAAPGRYQILSVPDGLYYLLAAAVPWSRSALTYLLPEHGLLVAVAERPVLVRGGQASAPLDLALRPRHLADPPILGVFPPLIAGSATSGVHVSQRTFVPIAQDRSSLSRRQI